MEEKGEEKVKILNSDKAFNGSKDLKRKVTREEFIQVMEQVADNINDISKYLQADVNGMYKTHVFPLQMRMLAIEEILCEKLDITSDEIDKRTFKVQKDIIEKAKESGEVKVDENGNLTLASQDETKKHEEEIVKEIEKGEENAELDNE